VKNNITSDSIFVALSVLRMSLCIPRKTDQILNISAQPTQKV